jgi:hypothetical protein
MRSTTLWHRSLFSGGLALATWVALASGCKSNAIDSTSVQSDCTGASCCQISGAQQKTGQLDPDNPCQSCQPSTSTSAWSPVTDGTACGNGEVCRSGQCGVQCSITGAVYASGAVNPSNPCQSCQPSSSSSAWTATNGASCGTGSVCNGSVCAPGCFVSGTFYVSGKANPGNACQSCQPATSTTAWSPDASMNGASCGTDQICSAGQCGPGCFISGTVYTSGAVDSAQTCQGCAPATSTTTWTTLPDGTGCASGSVCSGAACKAGCYISGQFEAPGALDATGCHSCQPSASTTAWSNVSDGSSCGTGMFCQAGACTAGCEIGGTLYAPGTASPTSACLVCQPSGSGGTTGWTPLAVGASCGTGTICDASSTCRAACAIATTGTDGGSAPPQIVAASTANPTNACQSCQPSVSTTGWSDVTSETSCTLGAATGACCSGTCVAEQTDDGNCGACGAVCNTGCLAGKCPVTALATGLNGPSMIAVDTNNLYWSDAATGHAVMKLPLAADGGVGTAAPLDPAATGAATDMALDATDVFWVDGHSAWKVPIAGGAEAAMSSPATPGGPGIAVAGNRVFWTNPGNGAVYSSLTTTAHPAVYINGLSGPTGIAADAANLYIALNPSGSANTGGNSLMELSESTAATTTLASNQNSIVSVTLDPADTNVFWLSWDYSGPRTGGTEGLQWAPVSGGDGGATANIAQPTETAPGRFVAVDGTSVYWIDQVDYTRQHGRIMTRPIAGGAVTTLATNQPYATAIAVDATYVYWVNAPPSAAGDAGTVYEGAVLRALK